MADLSKITLPNNVTYNLADSAARESLNSKQDIFLSGQIDDSSEPNYVNPLQVSSALEDGRNVRALHLDNTFGLLTFTSWNIARSAGIVVSNSLLEYNDNLVSYTLVGSVSGGEWSSSYAEILTDVYAGRIDAALEEKAASAGYSASYAAKRTASIPYAHVDSTSTSTLFTATVPEITELRDGVCVLLKNGVVTSASGFKININGLGAKPSVNNMTEATLDTTIFNINYTMLFVYDSTRVSGGCWICYRGYDANTNTIGYQLRTNSTIMNVSDTARYYKLYFTSADGTKWVPASVNSTNNATSARPVNQRPINPFGRIVYTSASTSYAAGANLAATTLWDQYVLTLGYSFNRTGAALTLTTEKPVYVKCAPQADGSAIMDADTPYVQDLPTTADGKIYIYLGIATSATQIELFVNHPVYYYKNSGIRLWIGQDISDLIPTKTSDLINDGASGTSTYVEADEFTTVTASKATAGTAVSCYKSGGVVSQTSYTSGVGFTVAEGTVSATSVYTGGGTVSQTPYLSESITPHTFADVTALNWAS